MTSFVLVHGGAHGAWCWQRLVPHLEADPRVHAVYALDLVGHGARLDEKPQDEIRLQDYVDDITAAVETRDLRDVVLVGHSLAGLSTPAAAARLGPRMRRLVLLSASVPPAGRSMNEWLEHPLSPSSRGGDFRRMFCNDLDEATSAWLLGRLGPEPAGPMAEPTPRVALPAELPVTYVRLERDEALVPAFQDLQIPNLGRPPGGVEAVRLDAGHSAMLSRPAELAEILLRGA